MRLSRRVVRFPFRDIERVYGTDNADNAGDDIVFCLREVSEYINQFKYEFTHDNSHTNPWFHAMVFTIEGMSDSLYTRFLEQLAGLGLAVEAS